MKVFISWSGDISKKVAACLHDWIPSVLQSIKPYMSAENIDKGGRWSLDIANQLQDTHYGIICVTPNNVEAPWVLFESGALSKSIQNSRVAPVIFGLVPSDLSNSPLLQFQLTQFNKEDMRKLMVSINSSASDTEQITEELLNRAFNRAWSELERDIQKIDLSPDHHTEEESKQQKGIDARLVNSIEEVLSNSRSQLKLLSSPTELLPPGYIRGVLKDMIVRGGVARGSAELRANQPAWRDLRRSIETLRAINREDTINSSESQSENLRAAAVTRDNISTLLDDVAFTVNYIYETLYGGPLFPTIDRSE